MVNPDADLLAALARQLAAQVDVTAVLQRVVEASATQIGGAEHAGITLLAGRSVSTPAATGELVETIDKHQYATGEGPCLTAAIDHEPVVRVDDLSTDGRWPEFAKVAVDIGVRAMLSFQLYTDRGTLGALNIYATTANAFTDESVHTGTVLAAHAAVAAAAMATSSNLRLALESRDAIGQAKGILMERYKLTSSQAFDLLITASQHTNRKLRDVAYELTETGQLTTDRPRDRAAATQPERRSSLEQPELRRALAPLSRSRRSARAAAPSPARRE